MKALRKNILTVWIILNSVVLYYVLHDPPLSGTIYYFEAGILIAGIMTIISFPSGLIFVYLYSLVVSSSSTDSFYIDIFLIWLPYFIGGTVQWVWLLPKLLYRKN